MSSRNDTLSDRIEDLEDKIQDLEYKKSDLEDEVEVLEEKVEALEKSLRPYEELTEALVAFLGWLDHPPVGMSHEALHLHHSNARRELDRALRAVDR